jgi:hypothetical protein
MLRRRSVRLLLAGALIIALLLGGVSFLVLPHLNAAAAHRSGLVTRGDAEAIFNAALTGCGAVAVNGNVHEGQPCEDAQRAQLRLIAPLPTQHYCVDDWHVIRVTDVESSRAAADAFDATFVIDGQPLTTQRTPAKPVNPKDAAQFGPGANYWVNVGAIVSPDALGVGLHTSHIEVFTPAPAGTFDRVFAIDASGTGACTLP